MKVHQNELALGTKIYRYSVKQVGEEFQIVCKIGEVKKFLVKNRDGLYEDRGKVIRIENDRDPIYFSPKNNYSVDIDEYHSGRIILLSDDVERARELFIEHEVAKIVALQDEVEGHRDRLKKLREI